MSEPATTTATTDTTDAATPTTTTTPAETHPLAPKATTDTTTTDAATTTATTNATTTTPAETHPLAPKAATGTTDAPPADIDLAKTSDEDYAKLVQPDVEGEEVDRSLITPMAKELREAGIQPHVMAKIAAIYGRAVDAARLLPETPKPEPEPAPAPADFRIIMPVEGDLIRLYSMDHLSYNPTTRDWRTHDGVDVQAAPGSEVRCAADGVVASVLTDEAAGTVVTVRHEGGFLTRYGNLAEDPGIEEGQKLRQGDVVGVIGETALLEAGLAPHLHFELCRDGESVNPTDYLEW